MVRAAAVHQLLIGLELVAARAEPAGIHALVHVAAGLRAAHHLGRGHGVVRIGGADEAIRADSKPIEGRLPGQCPRVDQLVRIDPPLAGDALHVGGVLVEAGQETGLLAEQPLVARDRVGADSLEQRVQRRLRARIEDGGGQVERASLGHQCSRPFGQYSSLRTCSGGKPRRMAISSTAVIMSGLPHR